MSSNWQDDELLAAEYVLYVAEGPGPNLRQPGNFARLVVEAMFRADSQNLYRLGRGFPALKDAVWAYKNAPHGREDLRELVKR